MKEFVKKRWIGEMIVAIILAGSVPTAFALNPAREAGQPTELAQIAQEYQEALNSYNIEQFIPRLAQNLDLWMPLGIRITSPDEFRRYMRAMGNLLSIGNGGNYSIDLPKTAVRYQANGGNDVFSSGTINEQAQFAGKPARKYVSRWLVHLQKQGLAWKIVGGNLDVDTSVFPPEELAKHKQTVLAAMGGKTRQ